jgi:hypothetical protein
MVRRLLFALLMVAAGMVPVATAAQALFGERSVSHVVSGDVAAAAPARVVLPVMPHPVVGGGGGGSCSWHPFAPRCRDWRWRQCHWNPHQWFCRPWGHPTRTCPWWDRWCRTQTCDWRNPWCQTHTAPTWTCDPWDSGCRTHGGPTHTEPTHTCGPWNQWCGGETPSQRVIWALRTASVRADE